MIPNNKNVICERIIATEQFQSTNPKKRATEMMMMFQYCVENDCVEENKELLIRLFRQKIGNKVNLPDYNFGKDFERQLNNARKIKNSQQTINFNIPLYESEINFIRKRFGYDYKLCKLVYILYMYAKANRMLGRYYDLENIIEDIDEIKALAGLKRDDCDGFLAFLIFEDFVEFSITKKFNKYATCEEELYDEYWHYRWTKEIKEEGHLLAEFETFDDVKDGIIFIPNTNKKICPCCGRSFEAGTKSKTDLCPECWKEERKLKDRLRKAAKKNN